MTPESAIRVLEALGAGCDPVTGEILSDETVLSRPEVLQALFVAIRSLRSRSTSVPDLGMIDGQVFASVAEAALNHLSIDIEVSKGPTRFFEAGWFYVGHTEVNCTRCAHPLEGFRKPYRSAGRTFHHWALVCPTCRTAIEPGNLSPETRKRLYDSSNLRPGPK